jgi:hypothetical protein
MDAYFLIFVSLFRFFLQKHVRYVFLQNFRRKEVLCSTPDLAFSILWSSHHSKFSRHKLAFSIGPRICTGTVYSGWVTTPP